MSPERPPSGQARIEKFPWGKMFVAADGTILRLEFEFPQKKFRLNDDVILVRAQPPLLFGEIGRIVELIEPGTKNKTSDVIKVRFREAEKIDMSMKPEDIDVITQLITEELKQKDDSPEKED